MGSELTAESENCEIHFIQDKLEEVVLTPEEETDYANNYLGDMGTAMLSDNGSKFRNFHKKHLPVLPSKKAFIQFIQETPTCNWNFTNADQVYAFFNATPCIVQPDEFLAVFNFQSRPHLTIDNILRNLSSMDRPPCRTWLDMPAELERFLRVFNGFDKLADCIHIKDEADQHFDKFRVMLQAARSKCQDTGFCELYDRLLSFVQDVHDAGNCPSKKDSENYVLLLINVFIYAAGIPSFMCWPEFRLSVGEAAKKKDFINIEPDMACKIGSVVFLTGEVKKFCPKFEEFTGEIPKVEDKKSCGEKEPVPRDNSQDSGQEDGCPGRLLSSREWYKVQSYLPQLLGLLLAAMQKNEPSKICSKYENVQHGFAVEGFKLRFVKLVLRDYIKKEGKPTVDKFLAGSLYKSDVFLTQEFNLFKRTHLKMFFQMLLAIYYQFRQ